MKDAFRRLHNKTGTNPAKQGPNLSAFMVNPSPTPFVFALGPKHSNNGKRPSCKFCHRLGHTEDKCRKKHGRRAAPPTSSTVGSVHTATSTQTINVPVSDYEAFLKFQATQHCGTPSAFATQGQTISPWIDLPIISVLPCSDSLTLITVADGNKTTVHGIGKAQPISTLSLDSILYVPKSPFNLLSINLVTKTHSCSVTFTPDYVLSGSCPLVSASTMSPPYLHYLHGHPTLSKLNKIMPSLSSLESFECESCHLGKHTHGVFPKCINNRVSAPFSLVHTNVWGPSSVCSTLGFQYFVTFSDDYSRSTWLFLMKNRSELFSIFKDFCAEIKTQFGTNIHVLTSDNALQYSSTQFQEFMSSNGILHESSCPQTPQQNSMAERKNCHLIETTRTLLLHANLPLTF
ncbi:hypothetical protein OSB04_019703 [Centaurea solstitialis]|uniref:Integrase catalytic domain-containing protein n=1 Tax=Centaurea solstitialis TaxID=347529 RepID=A0AA38WCM3_9ASTR|nr:hypothetical protein OSB04_019703 [Centaurea solstitialis]